MEPLSLPLKLDGETGLAGLGGVDTDIVIRDSQGRLVANLSVYTNTPKAQEITHGEEIVRACNGFEVLLKAAKQAQQDLVGTDGIHWQIAQLTLAEAIAGVSDTPKEEL